MYEDDKRIYRIFTKTVNRINHYKVLISNLQSLTSKT
jgi:hypothetical protein